MTAVAMLLRGTAILALAAAAASQEGFKRTDSRRPYAHHIELQDAAGRPIDPTQDGALPFSSYQTCKKCHDVGKIEHGWHFNAATTGEHGRPGEPWIWTDPRTGSQIPVSARGWPGTYPPETVGLQPLELLTEFGRHLPGGAKSYTGANVEDGRFRITGDLPVDCMVCHGADRSWSHEKWAQAVAAQDFAWASGVAMGLLAIDGSVERLPDDLDPTTSEGAARLPKTRYDSSRFDDEGHAFFDIVRTPSNEACYTCHSTHHVGPGTDPRWQRDGDVHLVAGMSCADCHRNGIEHHIVRGYEGERHGSGLSVESFTCRGCHMDTTDGHGNVVRFGGRLGAPKPLHRGLPPVHLQKLSCTACHSGPLPGPAAGRVQTSMAHGLGLPSQTRTDDEIPAIVEPVFRRDEDGVVKPHRMTWPAFWGHEVGERLVPIAPVKAYPIVRRTLRIRRDLRAELGGKPETEFRAALVKALQAFAKDAPAGATPVYVSGGRVYRLDLEAQAAIAVGTHADAAPYAWPLAHDVRPARESLGVRGCTDCHAGDSPFVHGAVAALGPAPDAAPPTQSMRELMELDPTVVTGWEQSFAGRDAFKWAGLVAALVVALVLLLQLFVGLDAVLHRLGRRRGKDAAP